MIWLKFTLTVTMYIIILKNKKHRSYIEAKMKTNQSEWLSKQGKYQDGFAFDWIISLVWNDTISSFSSVCTWVTGFKWVNSLPVKIMSIKTHDNILIADGVISKCIFTIIFVYVISHSTFLFTMNVLDFFIFFETNGKYLTLA